MTKTVQSREECVNCNFCAVENKGVLRQVLKLSLTQMAGNKVIKKDEFYVCSLGQPDCGFARTYGRLRKVEEYIDGLKGEH